MSPAPHRSPPPSSPRRSYLLDTESAGQPGQDITHRTPACAGEIIGVSIRVKYIIIKKKVTINALKSSLDFVLIVCPPISGCVSGQSGQAVLTLTHNHSMARGKKVKFPGRPGRRESRTPHTTLTVFQDGGRRVWGWARMGLCEQHS